MEWIEEGNPSDWIEEATRDQPFGKISRLIPIGYEAYCRILHPIFEDPSVGDRNLTWHEADSGDSWRTMTQEIQDRIPPEVRGEATLVSGSFVVPPSAPRVRWTTAAERYGQRLTSETDYTAMMEAAGFHSWPRYLLGPIEGSLDDASCERLVAILSEFTTADEIVWFEWFTMNTSDFRGGLLRAHLPELEAALELDRISGSPRYWWPDSRSWCVVMDMDSVFTLVGGSTLLIERLMADEEFECQRLESHYWFSRPTAT